MLKAAMSSSLPQSATSPLPQPHASPAQELPGEQPHQLVVEAHADINALLRVLEPFAVLGVTPRAFHGEVNGNMLLVHLEFVAQAEVAENLHRRILAMVMVHHATLGTTAPDSAERT